MAEILLAVTGGIAAYKSLDVLRILQRHGHGVSVVMTQAAERFVGSASFAALSGREVGTHLFGASEAPGYHHLDVVGGMDLMLIAPASANTIAKLAAGMGDSLLGACYLAFPGPVLAAPAMNTTMWLHPATRANVERLRGHGVEIIEPESGLLADGAVGPGRLADPAAIVDAVERRLAARPAPAPVPDAPREGGPLAGRRVLITAGGTREPIDAVRYVGNRSSGRMGFAIADAARARGAEVVVIASNVDLPRRHDVRYVEAPTAADLHRAAREEFPDCDLLVMVAAVADYRPVTSAEGKIDKSRAGGMEIALERTPDILSDLSSRRSGQVLVGFAAEHGPGGIERARGKLTRKGLDVLVHNDAAVEGAAFEGPDNVITILGPGDREEALPRMSKAACAERILDAAAPVVAARAAGAPAR